MNKEGLIAWWLGWTTLDIILVTTTQRLWFLSIGFGLGVFLSWIMEMHGDNVYFKERINIMEKLVRIQNKLIKTQRKVIEEVIPTKVKRGATSSSKIKR